MGNSLQRISGGTGCDIVTSEDGNFTARKGRIYAFVVRENDTSIASVVEDRDSTFVKVDDSLERSWLGTFEGGSSGGDSDEGIPVLLKDELIIPDYPLTQIHVYTGSIMVYYEEYPWNHIRR